jgi:hypothetical protein
LTNRLLHAEEGGAGCVRARLEPMMPHCSVSS